MYSLLRLIPTKLLTQTAGSLASKKFPPQLLQKFIQLYCKIYSVNLNESKGKLASFSTFNEFFTRDINFAKRKIDHTENSIISPVDGTLIGFSKIQKNKLYSTKGVEFTLEELVGTKNAKIFKNGYCITIYLSPADHHRIYAPSEGEIYNFSYFSGDLWPVNALGLKLFPKLFCINERLLSLMKNNKHKTTIGILKIGATIVGKIKTKYTSINQYHSKKSKIDIPFKKTISVKKAEAIAQFELGSTVILLFQEESFLPSNLKLDCKLRVGQKIGEYKILMKGKEKRTQKS